MGKCRLQQCEAGEGRRRTVPGDYRAGHQAGAEAMTDRVHPHIRAFGVHSPEYFKQAGASDEAGAVLHHIVGREVQQPLR